MAPPGGAEIKLNADAELQTSSSVQRYQKRFHTQTPWRRSL